MVLCSGAMRAVLQQLAPGFEKSSSHKLVIEYATAGKVEEKVAADEGIDVAILTNPRAEKLVRVAKLVGGTTTICGTTYRIRPSMRSLTRCSLRGSIDL
jgi:ABC-type molybdate transport system substrate-binding protein